MSALAQRPAQTAAASLCVGLALANVARVGIVLLLIGGTTVVAATLAHAPARIACVAVTAVLCGWWWASARLDAIDRSPLTERIGTAERMRAVVTSPPRKGRFDVRAEGTVVRFGDLRPHERVLLRLPLGRAPPQGAIVEGIGELKAPRPPTNGFDERTWLRRHGMHAVLRVDLWRRVGRRGGLGGLSDRLRTWLGRSVAPGLYGERASLLQGIVLGDDSGLSDELRQRFRASGLYHLLAVSGQNVALVAAGALGLAWLLGLSRRVGEIGALAGMGAYVLAVGPQPSVIRAGIAGALTSLAWLSARMTDRWHFLLVGAVALLGWNPYTLFDAGFQLSFVAVTSIFLLVPRFMSVLEGYPVPRPLAGVIAVSAACGLTTAPVMWLQFHAVSLLTVPANALAAPAMVPLLGLAFASAGVGALVPSAAVALAWINGWLAAYVAACARTIGGLPGAQIRSTHTLMLLLAGAFLVAAYAWPRWRPSSSPSI